MCLGEEARSIAGEWIWVVGVEESAVTRKARRGFLGVLTAEIDCGGRDLKKARR